MMKPKELAGCGIQKAYIILQDARYGIISDQQRHVFGLLFDEVDKDKNGSVTLQELKLRMQPSVSRRDIKHFVQVHAKSVYLSC